MMRRAGGLEVVGVYKPPPLFGIASFLYCSKHVLSKTVIDTFDAALLSALLETHVLASHVALSNFFQPRLISLAG
jgi:hypothetical protein